MFDFSEATEVPIASARKGRTPKPVDDNTAAFVKSLLKVGAGMARAIPTPLGDWQKIAKEVVRAGRLNSPVIAVNYELLKDNEGNPVVRDSTHVVVLYRGHIPTTRTVNKNGPVIVTSAVLQSPTEAPKPAQATPKAAPKR